MGEGDPLPSEKGPTYRVRLVLQDQFFSSLYLQGPGFVSFFDSKDQIWALTVFYVPDVGTRVRGSGLRVGGRGSGCLLQR